MDAIQFSSLSEFIQMGKHGAYVWSAYGLFALIISLNIVLVKIKRREIIKQQQSRLRREVK